MTRFIRLILSLTALTLLALAPLARAEAPKVMTQVPGYYRLMLGQFEVTALFDGALDLDTKLLLNTTPTELNKLLTRMFVGNPKMQTAVNAYLINTGNNLVLVDAGAAKLFGPGLGFILQNMKAAGYDPSQVDTVVITHLHGDHVGGITDAEGKPLFPKARILVAKEDDAYWLSQQVADKAPEAMQRFFRMVRESAAPYQKNGQWQTFTEGSVLVPGIKAVKANGHTPGHTAFAVESEGQKLLIWGDLVHAHAVQFTRPEVSFEYDVDREQAVATRKSIFKTMAISKSLVAGMHLPFPGIGHVRWDGKESYSWVPIEYAPLPKQ